MRAVQDFTKQKGITPTLTALWRSINPNPNTLGVADISGWTVAGASKRGWTTWMVGAVTCPTCPTIIGIAPLVPIVPALHAEIHRQWMSYGGFTFAFSPYTEVNFTQMMDTPAWQGALEVTAYVRCYPL